MCSPAVEFHLNDGSSSVVGSDQPWRRQQVVPETLFGDSLDEVIATTTLLQSPNTIIKASIIQTIAPVTITIIITVTIELTYTFVLLLLFL